VSTKRFTYEIEGTGGCMLELVVGDVSRQETDAIGNAANTLLLGGGGVDGAIHRAAGPELLDACRAMKKTLPNGVLPTGSAVITPGFRLAAKYVVHCVGPIYEREGTDAPALLASCYREALALVRAHDLASIALPSIATGVYGYPLDEAAPVAVGAVVDDLIATGAPKLVRFVLFDEPTFDAYQRATNARFAAHGT
jgi:O-acetyl-ADP-ribose deacetylase (regulator of RNase III)